MFLLGLALDSAPLAPKLSIHRVDASGEHVGPPLTSKLQDIRSVTPTEIGIGFLTRFSTKREVVTVTPTSAGIAATDTESITFGKSTACAQPPSNRGS